MIGWTLTGPFAIIFSHVKHLTINMSLPEALATATLKVSIFQHLALDIVGGVEDNQVQVHFVAAVPVFAPEGVGPRVLHASLEDLENGGGSSLVLFTLHLELIIAHNLLPVLPPAESWRRLPLDIDPPDCHPVDFH